jgi:predicted nucleotide-binding protein
LERIDKANFHRGLLAISLQLLGNDYDEVVSKTLMFFDRLGPSEALSFRRTILDQYAEYGRIDVAQSRLNRNRSGDDARATEPMPSVFISYSYDTSEHKDWVRYLAEELSKNGCYVKLDQWDLRPGSNLLQFMETGVRESDFVLLICTPNFAERTNDRKGGVGYEGTIVTGEIFHDSPIGKFVPLLRSDEPKLSMPSYLKSSVFIDFRSDEMFTTGLTELLRTIHNKPVFQRPASGPSPFR